MLVAGSGLRHPTPLGDYRWPLRCQTIITVNLPISGSSTSNLIIELILLSASIGRPGRSPGFPDQSPDASPENPFFQFPRQGLRMYSAPNAAEFSGRSKSGVTSRHVFAKILICQSLAGESGGPVSMQISGIH